MRASQQFITRPAQELPGTGREAAESQIVRDYMSLRGMVGWIGTLLPATLIAGNTIFTRTLPDSMSDYYYTPMRNVLVAALSALGIFLICYAGYDAWDRWLTNLSGFGLIGVAFCVPSPPSPTRLSTVQRVVADLHFACASVALVALAFMALRFTRTYSTPDSPGPGVMNWVRAAFGFAPDRSGSRARPPRSAATASTESAGSPCSALWRLPAQRTSCLPRHRTASRSCSFSRH